MGRMHTVALLVLVGCSAQVGPSTNDPDAGSSGGDDDASAMNDAEVIALPREPRGLQLSPDGLLANAAIDIDGALLVVGTRRIANPSLNDAALVRDTGQVATAQFVGGAENDQLYAVARNGNAVLGVGITRSYLGSASGDQVLLAFTQTTAPQVTIGRLYVAADEALQPRAVAPTSNGWLIGGHHLMGARGFVATTNISGAPQQSTSFLVGPTSTNLVVRRVISDGTRVYAVGHAVQGATNAGFVAAFDATNLAPVWGLRVVAAGPLQIMDAAIVGSTLRVVGQTGADAVVADLATDTGAVVSNTSYLGVVFSSIAQHKFATWIAGRNGSGAIAGRLLGTQLQGVVLSDLMLPSLSAQALVPRADGMSVIGSRAAGAVEVPLNGAPVGACDGIALGAPLTVNAGSAIATFTAMTVNVRALPLTFAAHTPTITNPTVATFDACH